MDAITSSHGRSDTKYHRRSMFRRFRAPAFILLSLVLFSAGIALICEGISASSRPGMAGATRSYVDDRDMRPVIFGFAGCVVILVAFGSIARGVGITNR